MKWLVHFTIITILKMSKIERQTIVMKNLTIYRPQIMSLKFDTQYFRWLILRIQIDSIKNLFFF